MKPNAPSLDWTKAETVIQQLKSSSEGEPKITVAMTDDG
jgi:hypothetical protein